jgi:hypothetical protein
MYEFQDPNHGYKIQILDTPGLADTRGVKKDDEHRKKFLDAIRDQVKTIDAVLVMANGTVERLGIGTEYALATISSMFPNSIIKNTGFLYTNVNDRLSLNTLKSSIPKALQDCKSWTIQNPIAVHSKFEGKKLETNDREELDRMHHTINNCHKEALSTIGRMLKWMDDCDILPTTAIAELAKKRADLDNNMDIILSRIDQQNERMQRLAKMREEENSYSNVRFLLGVLSNVADHVLDRPCNGRRISRVSQPRRLGVELGPLNTIRYAPTQAATPTITSRALPEMWSQGEPASPSLQ